jgi:2-polyprenyl-3-methyl-5-hydroxy-6-metoxy-1,4-benzoquinol methylase
MLEDVDASSEFDAIVCCDVIEHLPDPGAALEHLGGLLAPNGVLLLTLPDSGSPVARALRGRWWSVLPMHLQYFSRTSLSQLLLRAGFRPVHTGSHPKSFTARYYADRVAALLPGGRHVQQRVRPLLSRRLVAPDLHDRMLVLAQKT